MLLHVLCNLFIFILELFTTVFHRRSIRNEVACFSHLLWSIGGLVFISLILCCIFLCRVIFFLLRFDPFIRPWKLRFLGHLGELVREASGSIQIWMLWIYIHHIWFLRIEIHEINQILLICYAFCNEIKRCYGQCQMLYLPSTLYAWDFFEHSH